MAFLSQGKTNWKFLLIIVILAAIVGGGILVYQYLWLPKEEAKNSQKPVACTQEAKVCPDGSYVSRIGPNCEFAICPEVKAIDWESLVPDIKIALQQAYPETFFRDEDIRIYTEGDITADGVPEVLVNISCGATTCQLVLMRIENNKPVVARFKQKGGEISYLVFSEGAGGAGRYGSGTKLMEDKNTIYFTHHFAYNESSDSCGAEVYQWNSQTKIFEFNISLSNEEGQDYCSKICSEIASEPDLNPYFQRICR